MTSASNRAPGPDRRRRGGGAAHAAAMAGKVIGTIVLIMVITGAILACFAAVYIKTVIMPDAHLDGNFTMDQTSTIYYLDSATGEYVEHLSLHGEENRILVTFDEIPEDLINGGH